MKFSNNDKYQGIRHDWFTKYGKVFIGIVSIKGLSLTEKATVLNHRGIRTMTGKTFSRTNLFSFIRQIEREYGLL